MAELRGRQNIVRVIFWPFVAWWARINNGMVCDECLRIVHTGGGCARGFQCMDCCKKEQAEVRPKAIILSTQDDDWEALYVDGLLIEQGHSLGEGDPANFWIRLGREHDLWPGDVLCAELNDEDNEMVIREGGMPEDYGDLQGMYPVSQ